MTEVKGHLGSVSFDGHVVTVVKRMRGATRLPLNQIASIGIENAGVGMRAIRFGVAGGTVAGQAKVFGSHKDFAQDPYAVTFRKKHLAAFAALVGEIEAAQRM